MTRNITFGFVIRARSNKLTCTFQPCILVLENLRMSLSLTLNKNNKKVEQRIRKKISKLVSLRFWIGVGINFLCVG